MAAEPEISAIEETAADWMIRRDRGLSPAEERELSAWLRVDARHGAAFDALAETWALIGEGQTEPAHAPARVERAAGAPGEFAGGERGGRRRLWFPLVFGAAAAIALTYVGWWRPRVEAERRAAEAPFALMAATEVGTLRRVELPDGSVIQLNTDSAVEVRFTPGERRVRLVRGEAHFTVSKNRARPFIVGAAGVDVRVVGTVFNVRLRAESVDVLVTEGKVQVGAAVDATVKVAPTTVAQSELTAGQKVSVVLPASATVAAPATLVPAEEVRQALAWQTRRLDFDAVPLADIVAEINRYNRHKLIVADPRLETRRFGGTFPAGDYVTLVRMLEANFDIVAERRGEETLLRLRSR